MGASSRNEPCFHGRNAAVSESASPREPAATVYGAEDAKYRRPEAPYASTQTRLLRQNAWRNEDQQLGLVVLELLALEQPPQQRDVAKERHLREGFVAVLLVDTADNHGFAVVDQHRGVDLLYIQQAGGGVGKVVLGDVDVQVHAVVRRDLGRPFELERGFLRHYRPHAEHRGGKHALLALFDRGLFLVGGDNARARDDFALALLLERRNFKVQNLRAPGQEDVKHTRGGAADTGRWQVHIQTTGCNFKGAAIEDIGRLSQTAGGDREGSVRARASVCLVAELGTERTAEIVRGLDQARLDHHLTDLLVELGNQLAHLTNLGRRILNEDRVGTRIHRHLATRRQQRIARRGRLRGRGGTGGRGAEHRVLLAGGAGYRLDRLKQRRDIVGLGVIDLDEFRHQRLKLDRGFGSLELCLFLGGDFGSRRNGNDSAFLAYREIFVVDNQIQCLVPGHVLEPQCQITAHRVADNEVETGEIGQHLQRGTHVDVLKVERQLLAGVSEFVGLFLAFFLENRLDADGEDITGLVGNVFVFALGHDHHARGISLGEGIDGLYRRGKIDHIEPPLQFRGHRGIGKIGRA